MCHSHKERESLDLFKMCNYVISPLFITNLFSLQLFQWSFLIRSASLHSFILREEKRRFGHSGWEGICFYTSWWIVLCCWVWASQEMNLGMISKEGHMHWMNDIVPIGHSDQCDQLIRQVSYLSDPVSSYDYKPLTLQTHLI